MKDAPETKYILTPEAVLQLAADHLAKARKIPSTWEAIIDVEPTDEIDEDGDPEVIVVIEFVPPDRTILN